MTNYDYRERRYDSDKEKMEKYDCIIDLQGKVVGTICYEDLTVRNNLNVIVGSITSDKRIFNKKRIIIGKVDTRDGYIKQNKGKIIGMFSYAKVSRLIYY